MAVKRIERARNFLSVTRRAEDALLLSEQPRHGPACLDDDRERNTTQHMRRKIAGKRGFKPNMRLRLSDYLEVGHGEFVRGNERVPSTRLATGNKVEYNRLRADPQKFETIPCEGLHAGACRVQHTKSRIEPKPRARPRTLRDNNPARVIQHGVERIKRKPVGKLLSGLAQSTGAP
jgi:hypothetical protein